MKTTDAMPNLTPIERYVLMCMENGKRINQLIYNNLATR